MSKPLRVEIRELVVNHLQTKLATGEQIDVAEMTYEIAQSLVDVIMEQEEEGRERSSPSPSRAWARNICNGEALWTQIKKGIKQVRAGALISKQHDR